MRKQSLKRLKPLKLKKKPQIFFKGTKKGLAPKLVKKEAKEKRQVKLPNIYRKITDLSWFIVDEKIVLAVVLTGLIIIPVSILSFRTYEMFKIKQEVESKRMKIINQISYWQGIADKHKDYRDAYFQLSLLEYRLKNFEKSKEHLQKALDLDPNFEKGRELEKLLQ